MEKRALLAIALSVAILLAWQLWFSLPPSPPPPPGATSAPAGPGSGAPGVPAGPPVVPDVPAENWLPRGDGAREAAGGAGAPGAEVTTPLYRIQFGPDGAVRAWTLQYRGSKPVLIGGPLEPLAVGVLRTGQPAEVVALRPEAPRLDLGPEHPAGTLAFTGTTGDGLRIRRVLEFRTDAYVIGVRLRIDGGDGAVGAVGAALYWTSPTAAPGAQAGEAWHTFGEGPDHRQILGRILVDRVDRDPEAFDAPPPALKDPKAAPEGELKDPRLVPAALVGGDARWVALEDDYFIAALIPGSGVDHVARGRGRAQAEAAIVFGEPSGQSRPAWEGAARVYVGPKEWERLKAVGVGLEGAQARNYGHFLYLLPMWWFCVPLLWLMNFFGTHIPGQNYGVAIILLTVLVKALFYPLAQKSMSSMKQMQALQPQLNALKSKYRSDPQRFQREQMELFRKHKVNPMGGCLPMVVQIPIFYALYLTLQYSVELHGASFAFWITDLSKKDPYYVLPILMGVSMLVQQKMTPTVGDPRQARVMLIMPVIFTFMFLEFPTGLVLYWLVNNVLSIAQQALIDRAVRRQKSSTPATKVEKQARRS